MGVFHHETTPRNPTSSRRSIQPPTTEEMLAAIKNSPRPNACAMKGYILLCLLSLGLSIPELFELKWWENISSTATVLSWGPFAILCTSLFLTTLALCCVSRLFMGVAVVLSFLSLPCMVAQLAVCSTPAVLTMCCCFPSQCLLSLSRVSDELSKHVYLNETCRNLVPVQRNNHTCASSRAHFILFWISCATSLIFTSFLVTAQWYWIRSPSWRFKTNEDEVWDAMLPGSKLPPRRKIRLRDYHRQEDDEDDEGRDMDDYFEQEAESDSDSEEELTRRRTTRKHKKRKKKKTLPGVRKQQWGRERRSFFKQRTRPAQAHQKEDQQEEQINTASKQCRGRSKSSNNHANVVGKKIRRRFRFRKQCEQ